MRVAVRELRLLRFLAEAYRVTLIRTIVLIGILLRTISLSKVQLDTHALTQPVVTDISVLSGGNPDGS